MGISLMEEKKIALIMEYSQAAKSTQIFKELKIVADDKGYDAYNVGMTGENDIHLTYIHLGIMASILLNTKAVDFVVTGCNTGQGALMSLNLHPGVLCGYCMDVVDARLFAQVNTGNAISMPFAKCFHLGERFQPGKIFDKLFTECFGANAAKETGSIQNRNSGILSEVKSAVCKSSYLSSLKSIDSELLKTAVSGKRFQECLLNHGKEKAIIDYVKTFM